MVDLSSVMFIYGRCGRHLTPVTPDMNVIQMFEQVILPDHNIPNRANNVWRFS